ncbi:MAG: hypothetical protein OXG05_08985 [Gammaproteobacteria bacterium]|nr:hypothetical protein [Gammaproteobacteria bacterium]
MTWRLVTVGIPFEFESEVPADELLKRVRQRSVWQALRAEKTSEKVAFRLSREQLIAYVVKVSFWMFVRPVYYADIKTINSTATVSGRFLFQKLVRIKTWLILAFALVYEGIWIYRCVNRVREGLPWDLLIGYFAMLLPSIVVVVFTCCALVRFTKQNAHDVSLLIDELRAVATR